MNLKQAIFLVCDDFEADPSLWMRGKYDNRKEVNGEPTCFCAAGRIIYHVDRPDKPLAGTYQIFGPVPNNNDPNNPTWSHDIIVKINDDAPDLQTALVNLRNYANDLA